MNEHVEDEIVKVVLAKSAENHRDILTKNLNADLHEKHFKKIVGKML